MIRMRRLVVLISVCVVGEIFMVTWAADRIGFAVSLDVLVLSTIIGLVLAVIVAKLVGHSGRRNQPPPAALPWTVVAVVVVLQFFDPLAKTPVAVQEGVTTAAAAFLIALMIRGYLRSHAIVEPDESSDKPPLPPAPGDRV
jgi:hypothetical protein